LGELTGIFCKLECINQLSNVPIENILQIVKGHPNAVIGYTALWEIIGPDLG
jgi:hypothetical protein